MPGYDEKKLRLKALGPGALLGARRKGPTFREASQALLEVCRAKAQHSGGFLKRSERRDVPWWKTQRSTFRPVMNIVRCCSSQIPAYPSIDSGYGAIPGICVQLVDSTKGGVTVHNGSESSFVMDVKSKHDLYLILIDLKESVLNKSIEAFSQGGDGVLWYQGLLCVLDVDGLREQILEEAHGLRYSIHSGATKMYRDLHEV
ncbi:hypothetical protein MTR67_034531 [Solanum verrucosum]|uniref:Uncharacterized protein n=1 Tax=Solanum verrucosum TaxID=315347 RepID=A0AAF0ZIT5_SOLVR|nr:hypothetical protein MTR67_034531 [Solanum verrucosum]